MKELCKKLKEYNYSKKTGLIYVNKFTFLISILLSAQSRDDFVNSQTFELYQIYNSPEKMIELGLDGLTYFIRRIGLYNNKAKNIILLSEKILELKEIKNSLKEEEWYNSIKQDNEDYCLYGPIIDDEGIPGFRAGLILLNGIGRKSANVFLNIEHHAPVFPVDTHVKRIVNRIGISSSEKPEIIEKDLVKKIDIEDSYNFSNFIVWHGRYVCKARNPDCEKCLLKKLCNHYINKIKK